MFGFSRKSSEKKDLSFPLDFVDKYNNIGYGKFCSTLKVGYLEDFGATYHINTKEWFLWQKEKTPKP